MNCYHTGLPMAFCAHCQSGLPAQLRDDTRGFGQPSPLRRDVGFPSIGEIIRKTMSPTPAVMKAIVTPNPSTRWGWEQRAKTARMIIGIRPGGAGGVGLRPSPSVPPMDTVTRILLGLE